MGNKMQYTADWVNLNGAIVVDSSYGGTISNIRYFGLQEYSSLFNTGDMLYDRTMMRLFGSTWWLATLMVVLLGVIVSILPALIMGKLSGVPTAEITCIGLVAAAIVFIAFGIFAKSWWPSHHSPIFVDRQILLGLAAFVATSTLYLRRLLSGSVVNQRIEPETKSA